MTATTFNLHISTATGARNSTDLHLYIYSRVPAPKLRNRQHQNHCYSKAQLHWYLSHGQMRKSREMEILKPMVDVVVNTRIWTCHYRKKTYLSILSTGDAKDFSGQLVDPKEVCVLFWSPYLIAEIPFLFIHLFSIAFAWGFYNGFDILLANTPGTYYSS